MSKSDKLNPINILARFRDDVRNNTLDEVLAIVIKEPEYISNSQSKRQGYARATNDMERAIRALKD